MKWITLREYAEHEKINKPSAWKRLKRGTITGKKENNLIYIMVPDNYGEQENKHPVKHTSSVSGV